MIYYAEKGNRDPLVPVTNRYRRIRSDPHLSHDSPG
jgi:hypothetical protein